MKPEYLTDLHEMGALKNEISILKREVINLNRRLLNSIDKVNHHKEARAIAKTGKFRQDRAFVLLELRDKGVIDWSLKAIADDCFLAYDSIIQLRARSKKSNN